MGSARSSRGGENARLEKAALDWFLRGYHRRKRIRYFLVRLGDRPDAILEAPDGSRIGVEITHLFYDRQEAEMLLGRSRTRGPHGGERFSDLLGELDRLICKKAEQIGEYRCPYPVVLVVRAASPIFSGQDFEAAEARGEIRVPEGAFHEVRLLAGDDRRPGWPWLIRLDDQPPQ